jgi:hypothetical protein
MNKQSTWKSNQSGKKYFLLDSRLIWNDPHSDTWKVSQCGASSRPEKYTRLNKNVDNVAKEIENHIKRCYMRDGTLYTTFFNKGCRFESLVFSDDAVLIEQPLWDYHGGPLSELNKNMMYIHRFGVIFPTQRSHEVLFCDVDSIYCKDPFKGADWIDVPEVYPYSSFNV